MLTHDRQIIHSSSESDWRTPPECFQALDRVFHFTLDAAANQDDHCCPRWLGPGGVQEDALGVGVMWTGTVFLNPPYSRKRKLPIAPWVRACWQFTRGLYEWEKLENLPTIVAILPFAPQTDWYRQYVYGHTALGHPAMEEWRLPHRISFLRPDGSPASNAGVNSVIIVWRPNPGFVGPWQPAVRYWSYR